MTNKVLASISLVGLAMLASCSSDNDLATPTISDINNTITNSNVEIRLSSGNAGTRASIESDENGVFAQNGLGIYCLAKGNLSTNSYDLPIVWDTNNEASRYSIWMDNVKTNAVKSQDGQSTILNWADNAVRWYPTGNWHAYTFYGYYPHTTDVITNGTQVIANLNIDGTQDVIWGKTTNDDVDAYSAHYFRKLEHSTEIPSLAFSHKLMRLTFSCKPGKDVHGSIEPAKKMGVKSIVIMGVPTRGSLIIADKNNAQNEGVLTFDQNSKSDLALRDNNDKPMTTTYWVMDDEREIGQGILVPVPESADMHYYILVTMVDKDGNTFVPEHPAMLDNGATPFVAGKSYNVSLTIHGPREIDLNATLNKWIEDDETIDGIIL